MKAHFNFMAFAMLSVIFSFPLQGGRPQFKPDLVGSVSAPTIGYPGDELGKRVKITVRNAGMVAVRKPFSVDIVLSSDTNIPLTASAYSPKYKEDVLLLGGREFVSFMKAGEQKKVVVNGSNKIPLDTPPGNYFIGVAFDTLNSVNEAIEKNNTATAPIRILPCETVAEIEGCTIYEASGGTVGFALLKLRWSYSTGMKPDKLQITVFRKEGNDWHNIMPSGLPFDVASPSSTTSADVTIFRLFMGDYKIVMKASYKCDREKEFVFLQQLSK